MEWQLVNVSKVLCMKVWEPSSEEVETERTLELATQMV